MIDKLTDREMTVLMMMADGYNSSEMAEEMHLSVHTIHSHTKTCLHKLDARTRAHAVGRAYHHGILKAKAVCA